MNTQLLHAAANLAPAGTRVELYAGLRCIPPYDADADSDRPPTAVDDLRRRIDAADALLIATPEYNYGVPGVLKNAIDWASRPVSDSVLKGKPVAVMGAAPTNFGTVRAQLSLRQSLLSTDSKVVTKPEIMVLRAHERFDDDGQLVDEETQAMIRSLLDALSSLSNQRRRAA